MDMTKIKMASFIAREPDVPLFWHTLSDYANGDYVTLVKPPVSEFYYLNDTENMEAEIGYSTFKEKDKVMEMISLYKTSLEKLDSFYNELKVINIKEISDDGLKETWQKIIEIFSEMTQVYMNTEAAKFKKIEKRITEFLEQKIKDKINIQEIFLKLTSSEKNSLFGEEKLRVLKELEAEEEIYNFTLAISELSPLRLEIKNRYLIILPQILYILMEIGLRNGLNEQEVFAITLNELQEVLQEKTKPDKNTYAERLKGHAIIKQDGKKEVITGKEFDKLSRHIQNLTANKNITEIKGQIAMKGKVVGKVRKLIDYKREMESFMKSFNKGDIIVTGMTQPNITVFADKAAAIITDEGGITSHAAIISRELGIPCIVGTKVATKILEEGELIEVDADSGVVRRLSS